MRTRPTSRGFDPSRGAATRALAFALAASTWLAAFTPARAQEFAAPGPPLSEGAATLLERGLPSVRGGLVGEAVAVRWFGLAELSTSSLAAGTAWRGAQAALGVSRTGDRELGFTTLELALGWSDARAGAAWRAAARRLQGTEPKPGIEAGVGAWAEAAPNARVWASAPQLWADGEAPPLERRLELGLALRVLDLDVWLSRAVAPGQPRGLRGEHAVGVASRAGVLLLWVELRDQPGRGGIGMALRWRGARISYEVDGHPVLGETIKLGLAVGHGSS